MFCGISCNHSGHNSVLADAILNGRIFVFVSLFKFLITFFYSFARSVVALSFNGSFYIEFFFFSEHQYLIPQACPSTTTHPINALELSMIANVCRRFTMRLYWFNRSMQDFDIQTLLFSNLSQFLGRSLS